MGKLNIRMEPDPINEQKSGRPSRRITRNGELLGLVYLGTDGAWHAMKVDGTRAVEPDGRTATPFDTDGIAAAWLGYNA